MTPDSGERLYTQSELTESLNRVVDRTLQGVRDGRIDPWMGAQPDAGEVSPPAKCSTCDGLGWREGQHCDDSSRVDCDDCKGSGLANCEGCITAMWCDRAGECLAESKPGEAHGEASPVVPSGWQPMETAPRDQPFLVTWAPSRMGERKPIVEMVGGIEEYEEVRGYGEPEAYGWHPLPNVLLSPLPAPPSSGATTTDKD
jgi:hypothetical protein